MTFKSKHSEVGTWKVNEPKVQRKLEKQKLTFDQLLNKYTKVVPKDRPLKKEPSSSPCQGKRSSPRGESSKCRGDSTRVFPPQNHQHRVFLILHGSMKEFGCIVIR